MTKKTSIFIIAFFAFIYCINAVELWNGFNTEMTKKDVLSKARSLLNVTNVFEKSISSIALPSGFANMPILPRGMESIQIKSSNVTYSPRGDYNIEFFFINNKLFCLSLAFSASRDDIFILLKNQFGQKFETTKFFISGNTTEYICYWWQFEDKYIFFDYNYKTSPHLYYMDRETRRIWQLRMEEEELQKKRNEEEKRKKELEGIKF